MSTPHDNDYSNICSDESSSLQTIRGTPFSRWSDRSKIKAALDFEPEDGDIIIASYPRTGSNWLAFIVHQILTKAEPLPSFNEMNEKHFLEICDLSELRKSTARPHYYKHHFPYSMVKKNLESKILYIYRRPEDVCLSTWKFITSVFFFVDLETYFEHFVVGKVPYGSYWDHVRSYWEHKDDGNVLLISYESLINERKPEILKIAKFIGLEYYTSLLNDEYLLNKIIEHTSFSYMKENVKSFTITKNKNCESGSTEYSQGSTPLMYFRKGVVGEGKEYLTNTQLERLNEVSEKILGETDVFLSWKNL